MPMVGNGDRYHIKPHQLKNNAPYYTASDYPTVFNSLPLRYKSLPCGGDSLTELLVGSSKPFAVPSVPVDTVYILVLLPECHCHSMASRNEDRVSHIIKLSKISDVNTEFAVWYQMEMFKK
jgi:hypothetical protein